MLFSQVTALKQTHKQNIIALRYVCLSCHCCRLMLATG